jgi:hypothetical protein
MGPLRGSTELRSPVPCASVSLLNSSSSNAPRASLPLSVLSLGPKLPTSVPAGRLGTQSPPKILLVAMMLSFQ